MDSGAYTFATFGTYTIGGHEYPYVLYRHTQTHLYHALPLCLAVSGPPDPATPGRRIYNALNRIRLYFVRVHQFTPRFRRTIN